MSSKQQSGGEGEDVPEAVSGPSERTGVAGRGPPTRPPFDLNNFPFTFEVARDTASFTLIEPDSEPSAAQSYEWCVDPVPMGLLELNVTANHRDGESITSSITAYREENGRTYHAYNDGSYHYPNDSPELERLDWQFIVLKRLFNGKNYFAPWSQENPPKRVLDLATGTGMWAMEMAEEFESSTVIGTDLSPIQPDFVPPNAHFYIHDARLDEWWWPDPFDYIHGIRVALGAWDDFEIDVAHKAFKHLEPGGWFEAQELLPSLGCDDGSMPDDYAPHLLITDLEDCARSERRPLDVVKTYKQGLINAGFVDVTEQVYKIPINGWPKSKNWKTLGELWNVNCLDAVQGFSMALLHRARGLKRHQIEIHLMDSRRALSDKSVHAYQSFYVVLGRKPRLQEDIATISKQQ